MGRQSLPQRQLLTVRQILIALSIVACLSFIISYSGRIVLNSKVQSQQEYVATRVQEEEAVKAQILEWLTDADKSVQAEAFARNELNWAREGDQTVATLNSGTEAGIEPATLLEVDLGLEAAPTPENWELWLDLVLSGHAQPEIEFEVPEAGTNTP